MGKKIMIERQLFADIFNYIHEHESELPMDDRLIRIKKGVIDKYLADYDRNVYAQRLFEQNKSVPLLQNLDEMQ